MDAENTGRKAGVFVVIGFLQEGILMHKSFEAMTDLTLDAMLASSQIEHSRHHKRACTKLHAICIEIERYFGLGNEKLESWQKFPIEELLRSEFRDEGTHPIQGLRERFENLKLVAEDKGDAAAATEFCRRLNSMFLSAWSNNSGPCRFVA